MNEASRLILVRHGTCARLDELLLGRTVDVPLNQDGRAQARAVAAYLSSVKHALIECSPRLRARQTAEEIGRRLNIRPAVACAIDELDFGRWSGQRFAALERDAQWQFWNRDRSRACTPAGDSIAAVHRRASTYLARLRRSHPGRTLILVSHAEVIRTLLLSWLGLSANDFTQVPIEPASVTNVDFDASGARVRATNNQVAA